MLKQQEQVKEFHKTFGITINEKPTIMLCKKDKTLRCELIREELNEFYNALVVNGDIIETADAIADLLYVVFGAAVTLGIDIEPIFEEVHRSNMTKVGGHLREDGKFIKPDSYDPPNLKPIIEEQVWKD